MARIKILPRNRTSEVVETNLAELSELSRHLRSEQGIYSKVIEARRSILKKLLNESIREEQTQKSIFISYSYSGKLYAQEALTAARSLGFLVRTGFDDEIQQSDNLSQAIITHICASDCFLGIWTDDLTAENNSYTDSKGHQIEKLFGAIPSVWMPFELGVAASHNRPFRLLVLNNMHKHYYEKPFHITPKSLFEPMNFRDELTKSLETLDSKVTTLR